MAYFLRNLLRDEEYERTTPNTKSPSSPARESHSVSGDFGRLLRNCVRLPSRGQTLYLPTAQQLDKDIEHPRSYLPTQLESLISLVAAPSSFGLHAIARTIVLKYSPYLDNDNHVDCTIEDVTTEELERAKAEGMAKDTSRVQNVSHQNSVAVLSVECMLSVLLQLSRRDSELCVQALNALHSSLQLLRTHPHESPSLLSNTHQTLLKLREEACPEVSSKASSCLVALAVSTFIPEFIFSTAASFLCNERTPPVSPSEECTLPENLHRIAIFAQHRALNSPGESCDWWTHSLTDHHVLCSFDLSAIPSDSSPETPDDDKRLNSAIASDGPYVYVLNYLGFYKVGTGFSETVGGKIYASNTMLKASRNCNLSFCNGCLYLRRGQSSRVWVLDRDSLREIGEIMLQPTPPNSTIFSDGSSFYLAHLDSHSSLYTTKLNDSFLPLTDSRHKQKLRLTKLAYNIFGEARPIPQRLLLSLPDKLHVQASDMHMGKDLAILLARSGKVFYAGNGAHLGLQDTGTTWMELLLSDTIVQMTVGTDNILFRSGSGHVWVSGAEDKKGKSGKVRRLHTAGRKKVISLAASANGFAYVTEFGKVFACGKHAWRTNIENGMVLGLDGIQVATISLGKCHAVAITKQGYLYTWGANNLGQCGRIETPSSASSSPRHVSTARHAVCLPTEHLWIRDVASVCVVCGKCSSRGSACKRYLQAKPGGLCPCGPGETACLRCCICRACGETGEGLSHTPTSSHDNSPGMAHKVVLGPARVVVGTPVHSDVKTSPAVASVSCGNFHTILLTADRQVYTFGSNSHGQLGVGDTQKRFGTQKVVLPSGVQAVQVAAGAHHCVLRTSDGSVYTFGAYKAGQLGREVGENGNCSPHPIEQFGPASGISAGWIGANGDTTYVHGHTNLLCENAIGDAQIVANKNAIFIFPRQIGKDYVVVKRKVNNFEAHQLGPVGLYTTYCLETTFNVMWTYAAAEMTILALSEAPLRGIDDPLSSQECLRFLRSPELMVPVDCDCSLSPQQLAITLISSTYALTILAALPCESKKDLSTMYRSMVSQSGHDTRSIVCRFESNGGGWGYSPHSVDAIQFKTSCDIRLMGIGLYGGRGEYNAKVKMFRLQGIEGDELYVEELMTTDEVLYESPPRDVAPIFFHRPITVKANTWHVISVKIGGPSSDCGSNGRQTMESDGVLFTFRNSALSNNGTDVTVGQIPEIYFQAMNKTVDESEENSNDDKRIEEKCLSDLQTIRRVSLIRPSPSVFTSLLKMLRWASSKVFQQELLTEDSLWEREKAAYVAIMTLKILRFYTAMTFPHCPSECEPVEMADCVVDYHSCIHKIFEEARTAADENELDIPQQTIVDECISSMEGTSHLILSSPSFVLSRLSFLMSTPRNEWPLTALLQCISKMDEILILFPDVIPSRAPPPAYPTLTEKFLATVPPRSERARALTSLQNVLSFLFDVAFGRTGSDHVTSILYNLQKIARLLICTIGKELVKGDNIHSHSPPILNSSCRFRRRSPIASWDTSSGAADAVTIKVDKQGVHLAGVGVYLSGGEYNATFTVEVLRCDGEANEDWETIERTTVLVQGEDGRDTASLKLSHSILLEPTSSYAIRVSTSDGGKTFSGEEGCTSIRLSNGARISFSSCSLSENGTCVARGQIPFILYSLKDPSSNSSPPSGGEKTSKCFFTLLRLMTAKVGDGLSSGTLNESARQLVSSIAGYAMVLMEASPPRALEVVAIIDQLLPMVSSVNGVNGGRNEGEENEKSRCTEGDRRSVHSTVVQSSHPYSPSSVQSIVCGFDKEVELMFVEMEECSRTASADDILWLYVGVDRECYVPVAKYSGCVGWKHRQLVLPGNSLWFILESGNDVEGAAEEDMYGFRCSVTGYTTSKTASSNTRLEQELAWLSASACRLLVQLPSHAEELTALSIAEEETRDLLEKHGSLLRKGLNMSHVPTLHELHTRSIPPPSLTPELSFLRQFISSSPSTVAGALAKWLPTGPAVDPSNSQLLLPHDQFTVGIPAAIKLVTRDQFGRLAQCCALDVQVTIRKGGGEGKNGGEEGAKGGEWCKDSTLPPLALFQQNPFTPYYVNKSKYLSIGMMPVYSNWSYEELRLALSADSSNHEDVVAMTQKGLTTHCGTWFPRMAGTFHVECRMDGFLIPHSYSVEVIDRGIEKGERKTSTRVAQLSRARLATIPSNVPFASIRIRSSPSLSAVTIGHLPRGVTIAYMEELMNGDGKWLRLTEETTALHSQPAFSAQAWCLQYHKAIDRVLVDIGNGMNKDESSTEIHKSQEVMLDEKEKRRTSEQSVLIEANEMYVLTEGDKVDLYSRPSPSSLCRGEFLEGRREILSDGWIHNSHGVWIRVASSQKYILAEDAVGRSTVHSQVASINGNEEGEGNERKHHLKSRTTDSRSLRPSVIDCCRTVFAAFLWHEHLVRDAMAAATYLKFHPNLQNAWQSCVDTSLSSSAVIPPPLQPLLRLWKDVFTAVQTSIDQHLIMPSPPAIRAASSDDKNRPSSSTFTQQSTTPKTVPLCELCEEPCRPRPAVHMKMAHPGCGGPCHGYGYNSGGKYTTGWTGSCGDGGRTGSAWYLLCPSCRQKYLKLTPSGHQQERKRRWREFRLSSAVLESRPESVLKQNALYLLELNSSADGGESKNTSTNTSGWTINLFPTAVLTPSPIYRSSCLPTSNVLKDKLASSTQQVGRRDSETRNVPRMGAAHASDPGPKGELVRSEDDGTEVLQSPSIALKSLVSLTSSTTSTPSSMLRRPVMAFVIEHHDLKRVRDASATAVKRAVAFAHAFRVWNWLLRLVSSETSVSDVILQYVWSLSSYSSLSPLIPSRLSPVRLLPHPWRLCFLAGPLSSWMVQQMHSFLYTVAVILQSSSVDPRLRSLCFKAWTIQLSAHEQDLLILTCNILATVGGVLSEPSSDAICMGESEEKTSFERQTVMDNERKEDESAVDVKCMTDVTTQCKIEASSRQAMVVCLYDGSGETFWESGEDDKGRSPCIIVRCENTTSVLLCLFFDHVKDENYRVSSLSIRAVNADSGKKNILEQAIDQQFVGWIKCCIAGLSAVKIIMKGSSPHLRMRQLTVFGLTSSLPSTPSSPSHHQSNLFTFSSPQRDAFALFQAISSQAFSDELSEEQHTSLRERVLDLLFSRAHLAPLQTYVCSQMVVALEREVSLLRERSKRNYSYACGIMTMLVRVVSSKKGTEVFAAREGLLLTLSQLLLFSPQTVQVTVMETMQRLFSVFHPSQVDVAALVGNLLVVIAKSLSLQVRHKSTRTVSTVTFSTFCTDSAPVHWKLDKGTSPENGRLAMQMVADVTSEVYSSDWALSMRRELASVLFSIVHLSTDLSVSCTSNSSKDQSSSAVTGPSVEPLQAAIRTRRFWLAVAALSVFKDKSWLELVDGWRNMQAAREDEPEQMCDNHDDGRTIAMVHCDVCESSLCRDCFRILHLNKRNRNHEAHLIGGASSAPIVEIHEGCSRLRLHNILILLHSSALTGMVEQTLESLLPSSSSMSIGRKHPPLPSANSFQLPGHHTRCRFCCSVLNTDRQLIGVCTDEDCTSLLTLSCDRVLECGHLCGGVKGEEECLPCMKCPSQENRQDGDDVCVVCLIDRIGAAPSIRLDCGHIFHFHCLRNVIERKWNGPRIQFRFMNCPLCNQQMSHPSISSLLEPLIELRKEVESKAKMRLDYDGLMSSPAICNEQSEFYNRPIDYAMERYMYVLCSKCGKAYFGGESRCQQALDTSQHNAEELICGGCCEVKGVQMCGRHGMEYLEFKCRFCCSIAVYFCFGTTHFCAPCHDDFQRLMTLPKHILPSCPVGPRATQMEGSCPLKVEHAPTGEEFALGCGICRNLTTF